jgi:nicotinamide-nucleotide amidase
MSEVETLSPALPNDVEHLLGVVVKEACARRLKLVTAESCTAGLLASMLTDIDGCGHAFDRGFVAYTDAAKIELLGVPARLIERHTAVSREAARAMAEGALARSQGDLALAITGFAGPGAPGEEPGLVYFGLARRSYPTEVAERHFGESSRGGVRLASVRTALELLWKAMNG